MQESKRILYVATSDIHLKTFHVPYLEWLSAEGHKVEIAAEQRGGYDFDSVSRAHWMPFPRRLTSIQNMTTYYRLKALIDRGNYDLIHCHTPIPSALTRLAARSWRKKGGKLLYTAHGFHFYEGAPLKNWLIYYSAEKALSAITDAIITINSEDYTRARSDFSSEVLQIPGIGVNTNRFQPKSNKNRQEVRKKLGLEEDDFVLLYAAEFIPRKNHKFLMKVACRLRSEIPNLKLLFAGQGTTLEQCKAYAASENLSDVVIFLGFRKDLPDVAAVADIGISSSRHEGLGLALIEQMLCEVPVIASEDRGHREFVINGATGYLFAQNDQEEFSARVRDLYENHELRKSLGEAARKKALEFSIDRSMEKMKEIYARYLTS